MKKIAYLVILFTGFLFPAAAQPVSDFDDVCKKYKGTEGIFTYRINGLGCFIASLFVGGEESGVGTLIRHCSSCRLLVCEGERGKEICREIHAFIDNNGLEELMNIREKNEKVKIYVEEKRKILRCFFILVEDETDRVFLHIKGKFSRDMIRKLMKTGA